MERVATLEYFQWRLTRRVLGIANEGVQAKQQGGVRKAVEVFCLANYDAGGEWPKMYSKSKDVGDKFVAKLKGDLDRIGTERSSERVLKIMTEVNGARSRHKRAAWSTIPIHTTNDTIKMSKLTVPYSGRIKLLTSMCGVAPVMSVVLRYKAALASSQQWSIPPEVYEILRLELLCNGEGFASPFNSHLLPYGGAYCSLFPDVDKAFNSRGNVFNVSPSLASGWVLNPPFTLYHLNKASCLAASWLRDNPSLRVVVVGRSHAVDTPFSPHKKIQKYSPYQPLDPYIQSTIHLPANGHKYISPTGKIVTATFPTSIYICGPPLEDPTVVDRIVEQFSV
eukprot:TRINITY_DN22213_c0_g1_i1.p1 TRINITY_DN22213_c0_g1~~TRINITY_DN22213_c0_g1_i1.p1  ORF type:complete len:337 (+),score=24.40 TRINITY_DN22213_c0_g1_i1:43-1053(+)